ncbi:MAG: zinc-ribbon domain-containing protein [Anaerolineaceae bacterium]|nr:zinc-ribbon domain-containing protein [Anaerolineaceae bacterium]
MQVGQYFSLYFIPLFRIKDLGQYVVCQHCEQSYKPEVLNMKVPVEQILTARDRLVLSIQKELQEGMPVHMMKRKLISQKMDEPTTEQYVSEALDGKTISCTECGFEYIAGVQRCLNCDRELE